LSNVWLDHLNIPQAIVRTREALLDSHPFDAPVNLTFAGR
jgi:hypothetical protein